MGWREKVKEGAGKVRDAAVATEHGAKKAYEVASTGARKAGEAYQKAKPYIKEGARRTANVAIGAANVASRTATTASNIGKVSGRLYETKINKKKAYKLTSRGEQANEQGTFDDERGAILSFISDESSATAREASNSLDIPIRDIERAMTRLLRGGYIKPAGFFGEEMTFKEPTLHEKIAKQNEINIYRRLQD
jgi:hypothetical protein